jgi:hypothetical protein
VKTKQFVRSALVVFAVSAAAIASEQPSKDCPMKAKGDCPMHESHAAHASGVDQRGDQAMGFSHDKTSHHFVLNQDGGVVEVLARDGSDRASVEAIQSHLSHVARMFADGDFDLPMFIHDRVPPGVPAMKELRGDLQYRYEEQPQGGRVVISSKNPKAVAAVHEFLRFQIADHRTGDSTEVATQK